MLLLGCQASWTSLRIRHFRGGPVRIMMEIGDVEITPSAELPCVARGMVIEPSPRSGAENLPGMTRQGVGALPGGMSVALALSLPDDPAWSNHVKPSRVLFADGARLIGFDSLIRRRRFASSRVPGYSVLTCLSGKSDDASVTLRFDRISHQSQVPTTGGTNNPAASE
jgi:hypothetical protein